MYSGEMPIRDARGRRIIRIPEAIFFDVDRCALDTMKAFDVAVDVTAFNTPMTGKQLRDEYERAKRAKESYNVVGFINHTLEGTGYTWADDVEPDFVERGRRQDLLMKGARKIIDYAAHEGLFLAMFTYGASSPDRNDQKWSDAKQWQLAKIEAAGLGALPSYVCNRREKGAKISKWHEKDGFYLPDTMSIEPDTQTVATRVILLDDKTDSFSGKIDEIDGIRVSPSDEANQMDFQKGELPPGVVAVQGMTEALGALKTAIAYGRHRQQG